MKIKYTQEEFKSATATDKLRLECYKCGKEFMKKKNQIQLVINGYVDMNGKSYSGASKFCSRACSGLSQRTRKSVQCCQCGDSFIKNPAEIKKTKNNFCSSSCSATYNNTHKTHGTRRSKLEVWLEQQITVLYPFIEFHFNRKDAINAELDIFIPSMKLAFELNGIFHYEPIYGPDKLSQIQNNDQRKHAACYEAGIEMCWIDVSSMKHFKEKGAMKYLDIIKMMIDKKYPG